jgi:enoyl-CoA hydratase/carnithine racemase
MPPPGTVLDAESLRQRVAVPALALYDALKAVPVPTLAVVQGRAHGVGTALAAACDITVAAEDAEFRVPEMDRDIPPTLVMSALADRVPIKTLAYLVLSRRSLSGAEACAAGLVARAVPTARLAAESEDLAAALAQNSPSTVRAVKQFLRDGVRLPPVPASVLAGHVLATAIAARYLPKREAP